MKILHGILKYPPDYSGDGLRQHRMFVRLLKRGVTGVTVVTSWDEPSSRDAVLMEGITVRRITEYTGKKKYESGGKRLKKITVPFRMLKIAGIFLIEAGKADLVMTSGSGWFPSLLAWCAAIRRKPLIKEIVLLGSDDPLTIAKEKSFLSRWFFIGPFRQAYCVITVSPALREACLEYGLPNKKVWCRLNPVDISYLDTAKNAAKLSAELHKPVLLWVGTVSERKNVKFLLEAAAFLTPPMKLLFAGPCQDEEYYESLKKMIPALPAGIEAEFLGKIENPRELFKLYASADLFWFSSLNEGMANVAAESLVCGTPVVTLPILGTMKNVIVHESDGEIVDTESPEVFAAAVSRWLAKTHDRSAIQERAKNRFSAPVIDGLYMELFRSALRK